MYRADLRCWQVRVGRNRTWAAAAAGRRRSVPEVAGNRGLGTRSPTPVPRTLPAAVGRRTRNGPAPSCVRAAAVGLHTTCRRPPATVAGTKAGHASRPELSDPNLHTNAANRHGMSASRTVRYRRKQAEAEEVRICTWLFWLSYLC